ncbi:MAG: hypothetical protein RLZZ283_544 [Candidatus Parcubacteria bacterium]|jgi:hypothetical protein
MDRTTHEGIVDRLKDPHELGCYMEDCDNYTPTLSARILGSILVGTGTLLYGKEPSYEKFKAVEVIARIPYQSWEAVAYTLLTSFYSNEARAIRLSKILPFARHAQDNETMHVIVISQIVKAHGRNNFLLHTLIPILFSFFYYWAVWVVSMFERKVAFELNYLFEQHAYDQYTAFIEREGEKLKQLPVKSAFLEFYGRTVSNEYELFNSIRLDEIIHRNCSLVMVRELEKGRLM